jgi:hypothetical protein
MMVVWTNKALLEVMDVAFGLKIIISLCFIIVYINTERATLLRNNRQSGCHFWW